MTGVGILHVKCKMEGKIFYDDYKRKLKINFVINKQN